MSKTTYVLRDGELVEKRKPKPLTFTLLPSDGNDLADVLAMHERRLMRSFGLSPRREPQPD